MTRLRALIDQPDLALAAVFVMLGGIGAVGAFDGIPLLHVMLTVPLVLFLPGYALVNAALPSLVVPAVERLLISVGTSIALTILVGVVLGWPTFGLNQATWPLALVALTIILIAIAWARRSLLGIVGARPRIAPMPLGAALALGLAILIVGNVLIGARLFAQSQQSPVPVQLWMLPVSGEMDQARLGMRAGSDGGRFEIIVSASGQALHTFDLDLPAEQTWETILDLPAGTESVPIVARLYDNGSDVESRYVTLVPANRGT